MDVKGSSGTGIYRMSIGQQKAVVDIYVVSGTSYSVYIYDSAGYTLKSSSGIRSGSSFKVKLEAGKSYDIQICQQTGFGSYLLEIE